MLSLTTGALDPVAKLLEKDEPKVLLLIGAGVTIGATSAPQASWLGLLQHGVNHLVATEVLTEKRGRELVASLNAAFCPFDLNAALQHAELVEQNLRTPDAAAFGTWLESAFRSLRVTADRCATLDAISSLQQAGALLLTTNYDTLLSDITGIPPVTWEEHVEFLQAIQRRASRILHIHGHWQRPSSVVLGKSSYDRVLRDSDFQDVLKSLWLGWSWVYVGCGDGLGDPNLGRLLEWGKRWGEAAHYHYFLAKAESAHALASRPDKPKYLVSAEYPNHEDLPGLLQSITPFARCWPFLLVDENFRLFRNPRSPVTLPFPSWREYTEGKVPGLTADTEVSRRLNEHGWAFVLDVASVGKTTLALRIATAQKRQNYPSFYLDLAGVDFDMAAEISTALARITRPGWLLIFDNVHHQPELARQLWDQWRQRPRDSKLLMVATRMQRAVTTIAAQDLSFFEHHVTNPAVELRPAPDDLGSVVRCLYERVRGPLATPLDNPPPSVLNSWHRSYGSSLGAFCLAALSRLAAFSHGDWQLPLSAAADWVQEKWLKPLDHENRENVFCLAVVGVQELELRVQNEALPHPGRTDQLMRLGLVERLDVGPYRQHHLFGLREPGWGPLILAASPIPIDEQSILFDTAARHPVMLAILTSRLRRAGLFERLEKLWAHICSKPASSSILELAMEAPIPLLINLIRTTREVSQPQFAFELWKVVEREPEKLAARGSESSLSQLASFLDTARQYGRDTTPLWDALERDSEKLVARALATSLDGVIFFLDTAKRHGRDTICLWNAIEREPEQLVACLRESSLHSVASFLDAAKRHGRDTIRLWNAIEREAERLLACLWESSLYDVASFLNTAKRHGRDTTQLWNAIQHEPARLVARLWESPLGYSAFFLKTAKQQGRDTTQLWNAIEHEPKKLIERAWESSLGPLGSFLETAKQQGRDTTQLWNAIEHEPKKLIERVWETPMDDLGSFLDIVKRQGHDTAWLWNAVEHEPEKLIVRAWETPMDHLGSFLDIMKRQGRDAAWLWNAIEHEPEKLAARVWATPLEHTVHFQRIAKQQGRNTQFVWQLLESDSDRLSEIAMHTETAKLASFCLSAPATLVRMALANIPTTHWDMIPLSRPLLGGTWVASRCAGAGRKDLEVALLLALLKRANPRDFPPIGGALANVAWLLKHAPPNAEGLVPTFLDAVCTSRWLGWQFSQAPCRALATGLRVLRLYQPPNLYRRFLNPGLPIRIQTELSRFSQLGPEEQCHIIELVGSAALCGHVAKSDWFATVPLAKVAALPVETLLHRADAENVQDWQYQLWIGLRVVASVTKKILPLSSALIGKTLELWRRNLALSSENALSAEHRINQDMVSWLEMCSRRKLGGLIPAYAFSTLPPGSDRLDRHR